MSSSKKRRLSNLEATLALTMFMKGVGNRRCQLLFNFSPVNMKVLANLLVAVVAVAYSGFLIMQMFLWTSPFFLTTFGTAPDFALASTALAANQGLSVDFLAVGLIWSLFATQPTGRRVFFLSCVINVGLFGAASARLSIFYIEALTAALTLVMVL
jgi:putative membrane protein